MSLQKAIVGAVAVMASMFVAAPAMASTSSTGFLEICKNSDSTAPVSGPFAFFIDGSSTPVNVPTGGCTAPIQVPAGNHTVKEESNAFTAVTAIGAISPDRLVSSNLSGRTAVVSVPAGDVSATTTVQFTNKEVFGTLEVCKSAAAGSGLTGTFSFTITGPMGFSKTISGVPVGACSSSFQVPAGSAGVQEVGSNNTDVVGISTLPTNALQRADLSGSSAQVAVAAGSDVSNETIVTFVNSTSRLKICKIAGSASLDGTVVPFTANGQTVTAVAGPAPGNCVLVPTPFSGGTRVNITEGIVPGTAVTGIAVNPSSRAITGTLDLGARTVSVTLGSGETVVTYTDNVAAPGLLKLCKNAGPGVAAGQMFSFSVGSQSVTVPAGFCTIAGTFPFNSTQTVAETATPGLSAIGIAVDPASQLISGSANLGTGSVQALIGTGVTEVTYTNATAGTAALPPNSGGGTGSGTGATGTAPTTVPTTGNQMPGVTPTPTVEKMPGHGRCTASTKVTYRFTGKAPTTGRGASDSSARLVATLWVKVHGKRHIMCSVVVKELNHQGHQVVRQARKVRAGDTVKIRLSPSATHAKVAVH